MNSSMSDEELLYFHRKGFVPGPEEDEEIFRKRIFLMEEFCKAPENFFQKKGISSPFSFTKKMKLPHWHFPKIELLKLFDFMPEALPVFFSNQGLSFFQGAATWIIPIQQLHLPLLQLCEKLEKGSFFSFYTLEEILAHEAVHGARSAFPDSKFEEFFAYQTSSWSFRRLFGPLLHSPREVIFFFFPFFSALIFHLFSLFFPFFFFSFLFFFLASFSFFPLGFSLFRLFFLRRRLTKAYFHLVEGLKEKKWDFEKGLAFLFRLTEEEIQMLAKLKKEKVLQWLEEKKKDTSLRIRLLFLLCKANASSLKKA